MLGPSLRMKKNERTPSPWEPDTLPTELHGPVCTYETDVKKKSRRFMTKGYM